MALTVDPPHLTRDEFYRRLSADMDRVLDVLGRESLTRIVGKALYDWADDEPNEATGYTARHEAEKVANAILDAVRDGGR